MTTATETTASEALRDLAEEFWQGLMRAEPTWATMLGDRRFDDLLDDISPAGRDAERARLHDIAGRASAIDPAGLSPLERTTRSTLIEEAERELAQLGTGLERWNLDQLNGPQTFFMDLPDMQPISTPAEADAMVSRWQKVGPYMDQVSSNLRTGLANGEVATRAVTERVIDIVAGIVKRPLAEWPPMAVALAERPDWSAADRERFRAGMEEAIERGVRPAYAGFLKLLQREILPVARPDDNAGIMHVPGGADAYRKLILAHTTLPLTAEEIHEIGLREMDRIDAEMAELGARVLGTTDRTATIARLRDDPELRFSNAAEVQASAEASLARAQDAVPQWFGRTCRALCEVSPVPDFAQEHQTIAYYTWPALDGSRPGRFWINLYAPETRPRYEAEALAFHEAVPGHHLQIALAQELEGIPAFQRNLGPTAFSEGWGLYTERLADEMGLYSSDLSRFGVISYDAWRAGRLVVDTGIHAFGWSRQQAIDYLVDHTALGLNNIENEVDRYISYVGQALAYKIGQLEILKARSAAEAALGDRFDIRAFHDVVLGAGAIPLATLRARVDDWIESQRAT
ncbi:MAG TPA: DUF885 domain-containing protein [Candidatus Polarisedimenticolia bacterium]|nr:DUF885 domain-containing protein [Candidatus Polarisedimenticolia bacterium]